MANTTHCVTCGHHKSHHSEPIGCDRCTEGEGNHRFMSAHQAQEWVNRQMAEPTGRGRMGGGRSWDDEPPMDDLEADIEDLSNEGQLRVFALQMAMRGYDLVTDAEDNPPGPEWILEEAKRYFSFLNGED